MLGKFVAALGAACLVAAPAGAQRRVNFALLPQEGVTTRYTQGVATYDLRGGRGAVQITPLGVDHGRLTFGVVVLNLGTAPDHFGVEDIQASARGQAIPVLSRERLDQMARNRAMWTQIGVALLAGAAAASAAGSRDTYRATTFTPRGTYRTVIRGPSAGGKAG